MSTDGVSSPEGPKRPTPADLDVPTRINLTELEERAATLTPTETQRLVRGMARPYTALAIATLVDVCRSRRSHPGSRVMAAAVILERAAGKEDTLPIAPANPTRSGVMLLPSGGGRDEWEERANAHHKKVLEPT